MNEPLPQSASGRLALSIVLGALGGIAGAVAGFFLFGWLVRYGIYAIVLPGALAGIACGFASGRRLIWLGIYAAIVAAVASILAEWHYLPFAQDDSLGFFLRNLNRGHLVMMVIGVLLAFWFGLGRDYGWQSGKVAPP